MRSFKTDTFIENKCLGQIYTLFYEAYGNVTESLIELRDLTDNREYHEKEKGSSIDENINICEFFYKNGLEAMKVAFHRIVGLELFAMDSDCEGERVYEIPNTYVSESLSIPFDSIHELCSEGNIWFTIGDKCYDDDELDANLMKKVADYFKYLC